MKRYHHVTQANRGMVRVGSQWDYILVEVSLTPTELNILLTRLSPNGKMFVLAIEAPPPYRARKSK